jgi:hypothetical protein
MAFWVFFDSVGQAAALQHVIPIDGLRMARPSQPLDIKAFGF